MSRFKMMFLTAGAGGVQSDTDRETTPEVTFHAFPRIPTHFHAFPRIPTHFHAFPRISTHCTPPDNSAE